MTGSVLGLKRKRKLKKFQSQSKCRKIKDIFTEDKKTGKRIINGVFKIGSRYLSQAKHTNIYRSHTVTYKPIEPADNPAQLEFNCSGQGDYYIDLNSVLLLLHLNLSKLVDQIWLVLRQTQLAVSITFYFPRKFLSVFL